MITLFKQPSESRLYDFDFTGKNRPGETIATVNSVISTPTDLTIGSPTFSGLIAQVRLSGGHETVYKLTCTVTTNFGNTLELDGKLHVKDD